MKRLFPPEYFVCILTVSPAAFCFQQKLLPIDLQKIPESVSPPFQIYFHRTQPTFLQQAIMIWVMPDPVLILPYMISTHVSDRPPMKTP